MAKQKVYIRIDNLKCEAGKCIDHNKGYSFLPVKDDIAPEVYCGNCGGRVEAQMLFEHLR